MRFKQNIYDKVRKQKKKKKPYDQAWNSRYELYEKWTIEVCSLFQKMQGCAICEVVKLINKKKHYITNTIIHHRNKMVAHHTQWQMS